MFKDRSQWGLPACWLLIGGFVVLKVPVLNLPIYHDETHVTAAAWDILHNGFYPVTRTVQMWGHPPLAFELLAFAWFLFGPELWAVHVLSVTLAAIALFFTYLVGRSLLDEAVGLTATAMLAVCPLFFSQAGILHLDLPATTFAIIAVYGLIQERWLTYILSASFMALSKESSVVLIPLMAGYAWLRSVNLPTPARLKRVTLGAIPLLSFVLWIIFHKAETGFWWGNPTAIEANIEILRVNLEIGIVKRFAIRWIQLLWSNHHFVVALVFLLALGKVWNRSRTRMRQTGKQEAVWFLVDKSREAFMVAAVLIFLVFHSIFGVLHPRYLLPVFPFLFLLAARSLAYVLGQRVLHGLAIIALLFVLAWFRPPDRFSAPEANLDYIDIVKAHQAASTHLEQHYHNEIILASAFQARANLKIPLYGYVTKPLKVLPIGFESKQPRAQELRFDLVYLSSTDQFAKTVKEMITARQLKEMRRFESGRHFVALYR